MNVTAETLGDAQFRSDYRVRYAYVAGAMHRSISSPQLVVAMGREHLMAYLGASGMSIKEIARGIRFIQSRLMRRQPYGVSLSVDPRAPRLEEESVDLYRATGVRHVEAAAYRCVTPALVRYRLGGAKRDLHGGVEVPNRVLVKVSRLDVADAFMQPAPPPILCELSADGLLTPEEAELGAHVPMADSVCVEADCGGRTEQGEAAALIPRVLQLRDLAVRKHAYPTRIRVGAAGGIGTPHAAAAAFVMGADFVLTGSINQCTVEAGTSEIVKDLLQQVDVHDMVCAPAGDLAESNARIQVLQKNLLFPARARRLHELYERYESLDHLDDKTRFELEAGFFGRSIDQVWAQIRPRRARGPEPSPRQKMALVFGWYFAHSSGLAQAGASERRADFQIHCGPALGAFNEWVRGTEIESWRQRHVADIAHRLMNATADLLNQRWEQIARAARVAGSDPTRPVSPLH